MSPKKSKAKKSPPSRATRAVPSKRAGRGIIAAKAVLTVPARTHSRADDIAPSQAILQLPSTRASQGTCADEAVGSEPARTHSRADDDAPSQAMRQLPSTRAGQTLGAAKARPSLPARIHSRVIQQSPEKVVAQAPSTRAGQNTRADKAGDAVPARPHSTAEIKVPSSAEVQLPSSDAGRSTDAAKAVRDVPASPLYEQLAELQVRRRFYIALVNRQTNAAKALARRYLGWRSDADEAERERINGEATRLVARALSTKADAEIDSALAADLFVVRSAIAPLQVARQSVEAEMKRLVRGVPVHAWASAVRGLGDLGLAVILGEAGDLARYPKKGHVWKRLGLAPHEGKAYSTWRRDGGLTADDWIAAGYSPRRRAEMYAVVAEPLFKHQSTSDGPYRALYDRRRAATAISQPEWTKGHSHMDALRIMTKALVRDLWQQMRQTSRPVPSRPEEGRRSAAPTGRTGVAAKAALALPVGPHLERAEERLPTKATRPERVHRRASDEVPSQGHS